MGNSRGSGKSGNGRRSRVWKFGIAAGVLLLLALCLAPPRLKERNAKEAETVFYENREAFEASAAQILEAHGIVDRDMEVPGAERISYWNGEHPMIEFDISGFGLGPATSYYGIYYSVDGVPLPYQNIDVLLTQNGEVWEWRAAGDNHGATRHIEGNWYSFEAHF